VYTASQDLNFIYLYINHAHNDFDVSHRSVIARRLELPDSVAAAGPMSLKQLNYPAASCAELECVSLRVQ